MPLNDGELCGIRNYTYESAMPAAAKPEGEKINSYVV